MKWAIKHKSGCVLFVTSDDFIADNRRKMGWIVEEVKMTSREQFEHQCRNGLVNGGLAVFENGVYASELTRAVWSGWQASRAEIEVMLPDCDKFETTWQYQDAAEMLIEMEGLKVKK
ncbi:TPA: hypothetical protein ACIVAT_000630 [Salmonella enterica subsp. enterica serovar Waycross]